MNEALVSLLIAFADDELILGHRHSEWTGFAPHMEADVAFSSIAQDEIGHAAQLYALAGEARGEDADHLALGRSKNEYRHAVFCERPNEDWAYTLARHWLYDHADDVRLEALSRSADERLAALATKMRREERYHLLHADTWMTRLARGPVEGRTNVARAMSRAFAESSGVFEPLELEEEAVRAGYLPVPSEELHERFRQTAAATLEGMGLPVDLGLDRAEAAEFVASSSGDLIATDASEAVASAPSDGAGGGRRGRHTPDFDELWDVMTSTYRAHPGSRW